MQLDDDVAGLSHKAMFVTFITELGL